MLAEDEKSKARELGKKERSETVSEKVYGKVKRVSEGHDIVIKNIAEVRQEGSVNKKELENMIKFNSKSLHERIAEVDKKNRRCKSRA